MPTPQSGNLFDYNEDEERTFLSSQNRLMTTSDCLRRLRMYECLAYHSICGVFRAQGHLTPEKLKLLKEVADVLLIPECRHRAECRIAVNDQELNAIAECVAGPNNNKVWIKEARDPNPPRNEGKICSASLALADAVAAAVRKGVKQLRKTNASPNATIRKTIKLNKQLFDDLRAHCSKSSHSALKQEENIKVEAEGRAPNVNKEVKDEESSGSSVSTDPSNESESSDDDENIEETAKADKDEDVTLMPPSLPVSSFTPPPPVITVPPPPPVITVPPPPPVITVPPPPPVITVPSAPPVITVPSPPPVITVPPPTSITVIPATRNPATPVLSVPSVPTSTSPPPTAPSQVSELQSTEPEPQQSSFLSESEDIQFVSFPDSLDPTLPPLVVVPPAENVITVPPAENVITVPPAENVITVPPAEPVITVPPSSSFSNPVPTSTLVLPSGMSIQLREESEEANKRKRSSPEDGTLDESTAPKSMCFSNVSKMTPVTMVSAAGVSGPGQVKVTPIISRNKMATATLPTSLPTSTQKVIIVSNASSSNNPLLQRTFNMPMGCSVGMPILRANQPRLHPSPGIVVSSSGLTKLRPKMVTVPAQCRAKGSPLVIPMGKNTITLKQDNFTVVDTNMKRLPLGTGPTKILPKPQGSMFIVNSTQGSHKISTTVGGAQTAKMISSRVVSQGSLPEGMSTATFKPVSSKQNVVILQKGGGSQRAITLTNTSKDLMQKLMSKKCVVIQSSKLLPKNITQKYTPSGTTSSASNVVVLDLSQEQYRQNLNSTTIAEILQASGIMTSSAAPVVTSMLPQNTSASVSEPSSSWLPMETGKSLSLEEVTLPFGQSESIVTLDEAVELLGESSDQQDMYSDHLGMASSSQASEMTGVSDQIFSISPEELAGNDVTFMSDTTMTGDPVTSQIVIETLQPEAAAGLESPGQAFLTHTDGAVTIQHSNIDMPANMSLEEYSSQQMENQSLN